MKKLTMVGLVLTGVITIKFGVCVVKAIKQKNEEKDPNLDVVVFDTRDDAENVLGQLKDVMENFKSVSVADFKDMIGESGSFEENKYGWVEFNNLYVKRVRHGYILTLPKTIVLE